MSAPPQGKGEPITDRRQLVAYLEKGCKPREAWRIGTEHEKFAFTWEDLKPLPYEGERGIRALLEGLSKYCGWMPVLEGDKPIALTKEGCNVTLEPGGQVELSGAPLETLHQTCNEVHTHLDQVKEVCEPMNAGMLGMGFAPTWRRDEMPKMPKARYDIMRAYMPKKGSLGLDMMHRTCTVQVNLDFADEADMVRKFRTSLALQPIATALFANSPFTEGKPNGFQSYRSHIWTDTDPDRSGMLDFVFEDGMSFERYVDYILDMPMYFLYRSCRYLDVSGKSFRDFMEGKLDALPGERPNVNDWADHLTTAFPEVRLKRFLEMRGADGGRWEKLCALPALWVGLLYDSDALTAAEDLVKDWTKEERHFLRDHVPRDGLKTPFRNRDVQAIAKEVLAIAAEGLRRRARFDRLDDLDETQFLAPLVDIAETGESPATKKLAAYHGRWQGALSPLFREFAY